MKVNLKESVKIFQPKPKPYERILIEGHGVIIQGDKIVRRFKNKIVNAGLKGIVSLMACEYLEANSTTSHAYAHLYSFTNSWDIQLGDDTTSATTKAMTGLIGTQIGGSPNSKNILYSNPSSGTHRVSFEASWNSGTISGTIGEIAIIMRCPTDYTWKWTVFANNTTATNTYSDTMFARASVADGDFSAYTIDTDKPTSIKWDIDFKWG